MAPRSSPTTAPSPWATSSSWTRASSARACSERRVGARPPAALRISQPPRRGGERKKHPCPAARNGGPPRRASRARQAPAAQATPPPGLAPRVAELEETALLLGVQAQREHVDALDHRRDHEPVAPATHLFEQRFLRSAQGLRLFRQQVAKTWHAT